MIQQLALGNEKVMAWRIEGKIDQAEYGSVIKTLENKMDTSDKLNVYVEVPKMPGITLPAIWDGVKSGLANLKKYNNRLNKVAVVTDKEWLQTMSEIENRIFPGIDERSFSMEEAEEAKRWITH